VEIHGPGQSKILLGREATERWEEHADCIVESMLAGGGRSCINASSLLVHRDGRAIAESLASRVAEIPLRGLDDPEAVLAGFVSQEAAESLDARLEELLAIPGAEDLTRPLRGGVRMTSEEGMTALLPTIVHITDPEHPLARTEFPFPFLAVVEAPRDWGSTERLRWIGPTLALTAITEDPVLLQGLHRAANIHRLHLGPIPTTQVAWDQPHEGDLFALLYRRRAIAGGEGGP
jgi:acyl-CoA reductase-like NAD-dependent aldehyde dehydrogenase